MVLSTEAFTTRARFIHSSQEQWDLTGGETPLQYASFQEAYNQRPQGEEGYNSDGKVVIVCIEDGIRNKDLGKVNIIRTAGSGLLYPETQDVLRTKQERINAIVSHVECGAAKKYTQENEIIDKTSDRVGDEKAANLAAGIDVYYGGRISRIRRNNHLHPARAIYYDGTAEGFEASKISTLPVGFGISRGFMGQEIGMKDAALARDIALGNHGFGEERFTQKSPLYLVAIADNIRKIPQLTSELRTIRGNRSNIVIARMNVARI